MFTNLKKNAKLILSDGTEYKGRSIGEKGTTIGEVVFNTSMTGYLETLTDASYFGQIVTQTFPLIGNYGVCENDAEGEKPQLFGYIVKDCCKASSNFRSEQNLNDWLTKNKIIAIEGIDTRCLTRKIREKGVLNGAITTDNLKKEDLLEKIKNFKIENAIEKTSTKKTKIIKSNQKNAKNYIICVLDFGIKKSIIKNLEKDAKTIFLMPFDTKKEQIEEIRPDGIVLSNGPGDPTENKEIIDNVKKIQSLKIPMFGICMGHQLLALANGFKTEKLKYGHRGTNQPVLDLNLNKILITSQNHGYCVVCDSIDKKIAKISHKNVNDNSCEGLKYYNSPSFSVQFHPEAAAGPLDANFLFCEFFKLIDQFKNI